MEKKRIEIIDFLRGLAIILMILANFTPYFNNSANIDFFRVVYSFAAPIFLFISGYSFFISQRSISSSINKIKYGLYIIFTAVCIDLLIWKIIPFCTFDILYIIGFGYIINAFAFKFTPIVKIILILIIVCIPLIFKSYINYRFQLNELELSNIEKFNWSNYLIIRPLNRFLFDGWFPIFPWLSLILFGYLFAENRVKIYEYRKIIYILALLIYIGGIIFIYKNITYKNRNGYIELFYPPSFDFLLSSISICVLIGLIISKLEFLLFWKHNLFVKLGKNSLYIYIFHCLIIEYIIPYFNNVNQIYFWLYSLSTMLSIYILIVFKDYLKYKIKLFNSRYKD